MPYPLTLHILYYPFLAFFGPNERLSEIGVDPDWTFNPDFMYKMLLAIFAGCLIGLEREYKGKDAGLKTNILVSVGACAYVILSLKFFGSEYADITRVLSQVVTGIGFLGAGVILKRNDTVKGLTTAATVWCSAAAGCIAALYMVSSLIIFTVSVLLINVLFGLLGKKF